MCIFTGILTSSVRVFSGSIILLRLYLSRISSKRSQPTGLFPSKCLRYICHSFFLPRHFIKTPQKLKIKLLGCTSFCECHMSDFSVCFKVSYLTSSVICICFSNVKFDITGIDRLFQCDDFFCRNQRTVAFHNCAVGCSPW